MALSTVIMPEKMYSLYNNIEDFTFSMPGGWDDYTISVFLEACHKYVEDLRNHAGNFMRQWSRIVSYGQAMTSNMTCFNITVTMELAKVLKAYLLKNENAEEFVNNVAFKDLLDDTRDLLAYFPNANESQIPALHLKKCEYSPANKPASVAEVIKLVSKQYKHLFGAKGIPTNVLWSEMSQKVSEKTGIKVDVKQFLEQIKVAIAIKVRKETDNEDKIKKFLTLAKDYLAYFDYIPPRHIKKSEFLPPELIDGIVEKDLEDYKQVYSEGNDDNCNQIVQFSNPIEYLSEDYMPVDDVGAYCEIPYSEETDPYNSDTTGSESSSSSNTSDWSSDEEAYDRNNNNDISNSSPTDMDTIYEEEKDSNSLPDLNLKDDLQVINKDTSEPTVANETSETSVSLNLSNLLSFQRSGSHIIREGVAVTTERLYCDQAFCSRETLMQENSNDEHSYQQTIETVDLNHEADFRESFESSEESFCTRDEECMPEKESRFVRNILVNEPSRSSFPKIGETVLVEKNNLNFCKYLSNTVEAESTVDNANTNCSETLNVLANQSSITSKEEDEFLFYGYSNFIGYSNKNVIQNDSVTAENNLIDTFSESLCIEQVTYEEQLSRNNLPQNSSIDSSADETIEEPINEVSSFPDLTKSSQHLSDKVEEDNNLEDSGNLSGSLENLISKSRDSSPLSFSEAVEKIMIEDIQSEDSTDDFFYPVIAEESENCNRISVEGTISMETTYKENEYGNNLSFSGKVLDESEITINSEHNISQLTLKEHNEASGTFFCEEKVCRGSDLDESVNQCVSEPSLLNEQIHKEFSLSQCKNISSVENENCSMKQIKNRSMDSVEDKESKTKSLDKIELDLLEKQTLDLSACPKKPDQKLSEKFIVSEKEKSEDSLLCSNTKSSDIDMDMLCQMSSTISVNFLTSDLLSSSGTDKSSPKKAEDRNSPENVTNNEINENSDNRKFSSSEIESDLFSDNMNEVLGLKDLKTSVSNKLQKLSNEELNLNHSIEECKVPLNRVIEEKKRSSISSELGGYSTVTSLFSTAAGNEKVNNEHFKIKECEVRLRRLNEEELQVTVFPPESDKRSILQLTSSTDFSKMCGGFSKMENLTPYKSKDHDHLDKKVSSTRRKQRLFSTSSYFSFLKNVQEQFGVETKPSTVSSNYVMIRTDYKVKTKTDADADNSKNSFSWEGSLVNDENNLKQTTDNHEPPLIGESDNNFSKQLNNACCNEILLSSNGTCSLTNSSDTEVHSEVFTPNPKQITVITKNVDTDTMNESEERVNNNKEIDRINETKNCALSRTCNDSFDENNQYGMKISSCKKHDNMPLSNKRKACTRKSKFSKKFRSSNAENSDLFYSNETNVFRLKECSVVLDRALPYPYNKLVEETTIKPISSNVKSNLERPELVSNNVKSNLERPELVSNNVKSDLERPELVSNNVKSNLERPELVSNNVKSDLEIPKGFLKLNESKKVIPTTPKHLENKTNIRSQFEEEIVLSDEDDSPFLGFDCVPAEVITETKYKNVNFERSDNAGIVFLNSDVVVLKEAVVVLRDFIQDVASSLETDPKRHVCSCNCLKLMKESCDKYHVPNFQGSNNITGQSEINVESEVCKDKSSEVLYIEEGKQRESFEPNILDLNHEQLSTKNNNFAITVLEDDCSDDVVANCQKNILLSSPVRVNDILTVVRSSSLGLTTEGVKVLQEYRKNEVSASKELRYLIDNTQELGSEVESVAVRKYRKLFSYRWFFKFISEIRKHKNWKAQLKWKLEKEVQEIEKNKLQLIDKLYELLLTNE